jgi:Protein of unknown function (DUF1236)
MKNRMAVTVTLGAIVFGCWAGAPYASAQTINGGNGGATGPAGSTGATGAAASDAGVSGAIEQKPLLTPAQRITIYAEVSKDKSKTSPKDFSPVIGADVPPMIELYELPDDAVADVPAAKLYKYTMVENRVVVVDPTKMRVVDVIGPAPQQQ